MKLKSVSIIHINKKKLQAKEGIKMTLDVTCERVNDFKSQLTMTLDQWSRAITLIDSAVPVVNEENRFVIKCHFVTFL